jgi:hypothetical protein
MTVKWVASATTELKMVETEIDESKWKLIVERLFCI